MKYMQDNVKISIGFERFVFFLLLFIMLCHIVTCLWVFVAVLQSDDESWISDFEEQTSGQKYLTSFYFTITTITTVGYGDISATNAIEQVFCIAVMFIGVISFSFASGSLASIL